MESPYPIPVPAGDILPTAAEVRYRLHVRRVEVDFLRRLLRLLQDAEDQSHDAAPRLAAYARSAEPAGVGRG